MTLLMTPDRRHAHAFHTRDRAGGRIGRLVLAAVAAFALVAAPARAAEEAAAREQAGKGDPMVVIRTSLGDITVELFQDKAPKSVANFLEYVDDGFYDGTTFHRVIKDFMIQGGGYTKDGKQKPTRPPIKNEADNGLKNKVGTLAMARTSAVDSATAQFFINTKDNEFLNHGSRDFGYAVFGKVTDGMDVVEKIEGVETGRSDAPKEPVVIESVERK